ncbi:MAG: MFS transporter [Legionellaceae bacterium]|nr:MFS transporter [Legionellaceae bacterium]
MYPWSRTVWPIALLFSFRLIGLFALIPVFSVLATHYAGATPAKIGLALGIYGLTQAMFQMPFGWLSDKFGRKPLILIGFVLFALGSFLGAVATSLQMIIFARMLQGGGAVGSVLIALLADLTREEERTRAMAVIGMSIGLSFGLAMVFSPYIAQKTGLSGIFYATTGLSLLGICITAFYLPFPPLKTTTAESPLHWSRFTMVLQESVLRRLDFGIFCQHTLLTSSFFVIPLWLKDFATQGHGFNIEWFYLLVVFGAFLLMLPWMIWSEKKKKMPRAFHIAIGIIVLFQGILIFSGSTWWMFCMAVFGYFIGFHLIEAALPAFVAKYAHPEAKGTAMGIYSTCQFLGIFAGGSLAGLLYGHYGAAAVFCMNTLIALLWWTIGSVVPSPK